MAAVLQGEVWDMDFDPVQGREQGGFRPALVVSNDAFNPLGFQLVVVVAITTRIRGWEFEVLIEPPEGGLRAPSVVLAHQFRTVSQSRLLRRRGQVRASTLDDVLSIMGRIWTRTTGGGSSNRP